MRTIDLLSKAVDPLQFGRDLAIDDLNDLLTAGTINHSEQNLLVSRLLENLPKEADPSVLESTFNLLGNAFENDICREEIAIITIKLADRLSPGCLVHAIPIIFASGYPGTRELVERYVLSDNAAVRSTAIEAIGSRNE